jgi:hypothetical protein
MFQIKRERRKSNNEFCLFYKTMSMDFMKFHTSLSTTSAKDLRTNVMVHLAYALKLRPGERCYIPLKKPLRYSFGTSSFNRIVFI